MTDVTAPQFQTDVNKFADVANGGINQTVTMRLGQNVDSVAKTINDIKLQATDEINRLALGFNFTDAGFDFATGGTLTANNQLVSDSFGNSWQYQNPIPTGGFVVAPGTVPSSPTWEQRTFNEIDNISGLREELEIRTVNLTLAEASAKTDLKAGQYVRLTDRGGNWLVSEGQTPNGRDIIDIGNGKYLVLDPDDEVNAKTVGGIFSDMLAKYDTVLSRNDDYSSNSIDVSGRFSLKGKDNTISNTDLTSPLFNDNTLGGTTFELKQVNLELNKNSVTPGNLAGGGVWLGLRNQPSKLWNKIVIEDVNINEAFRVSLNFQGSQHVRVINTHDTNSGLDTGDINLFAYGLVLEDCTDIEVHDYSMKNAFGFGMHIINSQNANCSNINFDSMTFNGEAIGLTITESNNVTLNSYDSRADGDATEINASTNVTCENFTWTSTGTRRGLLMGDNGSGIDGRNVILRNGFINSENGAFSAAINYQIDLTFENVVFSKPISFLANDTRSKRHKYINCEINDNINSAYLKIYMNYEDTRFNDCAITKKDNKINFRNIEPDKLLDTNESVVIPLGAMGGLEESFSFEVETSAFFTSAPKNQAGWRKYRVVYDSDGSGSISGVSIELIDSKGAQTARYADVEISGNDLVMINNSGVQIRANFYAEGFI